ncbi:Glycerophosphoryl diester phosphodiesterase precursor [Aquisphaera giovannonii]|uniref:Glycerophosphoryl diester phosphodiesterase n=1 Tax=Aquisphaera giovannonii TaxID=406548 RepID=A0A5B9W1F7_9BACT|nr:glycerophosphodiester phosphodiesterase family protein [Aquisphaera giovannonii]QEH34031.1 Glycerophosphoryl diester phosphodiesterase precursor [Aquisphaera giovannonii]
MSNLLLQLLASGRRPAVVAHRGDSCHAPENTLDAARLAYSAGADAWELDVQLTRDGVPVVVHDEFLGRTTDIATRFAGDPRGAGGFRLSDFDLAEVLTLDGGSWFVRPAGGRRSAVDFGTLGRIPPERRALFESGGVRIPTLAEALGLTVELDWLVNVEIKSFPESPPGLLEAVVRTIRETGSGRRVLVSSFDHRDVARLGELVGEDEPPARGILTETPLFRPAEYTGRLVGAQTYHASSGSLGSGSIAYRRSPSTSSLRGDDIRALREAGIPVLVYTVNDSRPGGLGEHLAGLGVDALITDDPAAMAGRMAEIGRRGLH